MSNEQEQQQGQQQENDGGKVEKRYLGIIASLTALMKGPENLKPKKKVAKTEISNLIDELFKEENEELVKNTKLELATLLKAFTTMNLSFSEERKKLEKKEEEEKKKFCDQADKLFRKIDDIPGIQKSYEEALRLASTKTN